MPKYKLETGLCSVREQPYCASDKEAWEYLRKNFPESLLHCTEKLMLMLCTTMLRNTYLLIIENTCRVHLVMELIMQN